VARCQGGDFFFFLLSFLFLIFFLNLIRCQVSTSNWPTYQFVKSTNGITNLVTF
jgi:hypothetical protein